MMQDWGRRMGWGSDVWIYSKGLFLKPRRLRGAETSLIMLWDIKYPKLKNKVEIKRWILKDEMYVMNSFTPL